MNTAIVVPARLQSTRFPRKLLHPVCGRPVILWTADRIRTEAPEFPLFFAVDSRELADVLEGADYQAILTDPELPSGTDRIAAANASIGADRVINVQADEPLVSGHQLRMLNALMDTGADMATLVVPLTDPDDFVNPNHVKVALGRDGRALYFSRAPIPHMRDAGGHFDVRRADGAVFIHLGLYAYTAAFLGMFSRLEPGTLEQLEKLEMLRALEHGYCIRAAVSHDPSIEIDTPENAVEFEAYLENRGRSL